MILENAILHTNCICSAGMQLIMQPLSSSTPTQPTMLTKQQLADTYSLSLNTVRETIRACGLDTSAKSYDPKEIETRFCAARTMINKGATYQQVAAHFQVQANQIDQPEESDDPSAAIGEGQNIIAEMVTQEAYSFVKTVVKTVLSPSSIASMTRLAMAETVSDPGYAKSLRNNFSLGSLGNASQPPLPPFRRPLPSLPPSGSEV